MFKYKVSFFGYPVVEEFESRYHIGTLQAKLINGASMVYFKDVEVGMNLAQVEEMEINGIKYLLKAYEL